MRYETYLFDADNTLFDFDESAVRALGTSFRAHGLPYSAATQQTFTVINNAAWASFETGEISLDTLITVRFERLAAALGLSNFPDAAEFNSLYLYELGKASILIDGAYELCEALRGRGARLYIVSNGLLQTKNARVEHSPLARFFDSYFVSQEVGYQKPQREFFERIFEAIPSFDLAKTLMVGDSLTADIGGGASAGLDTCWFNRHDIENTTGILPKFDVRRLAEVLKIG